MAALATDGAEQLFRLEAGRLGVPQMDILEVRPRAQGQAHLHVLERQRVAARLSRLTGLDPGLPQLLKSLGSLFDRAQVCPLSPAREGQPRDPRTVNHKKTAQPASKRIRGILPLAKDGLR